MRKSRYYSIFWLLSLQNRYLLHTTKKCLLQPAPAKHIENISIVFLFPLKSKLIKTSPSVPSIWTHFIAKYQRCSLLLGSVFHEQEQVHPAPPQSLWQNLSSASVLQFLCSHPPEGEMHLTYVFSVCMGWAWTSPTLAGLYWAKVHAVDVQYFCKI